MSSALPYMQFYVADYLADTVHLSTIEHGAYLLLLMNYWQRGEALDSDDKRLSRIAKLSIKDWLKVKVIIGEFFTEKDGKWHHKRVERELDLAEAHVEQRRKAGRASAQRRANGISTAVERPLDERAEIPEQNREEQNKPPLSPPQGDDVGDYHEGTSYRVRGTVRKKTSNGKYNIRDSIDTALQFRRSEEARRSGREGSDQDPALLPGLRKGSA